MKNSVIFIMGVSGSGKTTVGKLLSARLNIPFFDGDDYHPLANKEKMKNGIALSDEDRQEWLVVMNQLANKEMNKQGAVIACSALKQSYRKKLMEGMDSGLYWVFLDGDYSRIHQRLEERKGHYMPPALLQSQFDILERPDDAINMDIEQTPEKITEMIIAHLNILAKENDG